jgi:hypothetical protein
MHDAAIGLASDRSLAMRIYIEDQPEFVEIGSERDKDEMEGCGRRVTVIHKRIGIITGTILALSIMAIAFGQEDVVTAAHATIKKVDSIGKTIAVKTDDGIDHTLHFLDSTAIHGGDAADVAAKDSWHGLKEGGEVVVHYTKKGTEDTAVEIDKIGSGGFEATEGTVEVIDRGGKKLVVAAGDGTEETFRLTGRAANETGADIGKGSKVTVFYIGKAGKKVAHFLGTTSSGPS